MVACPNQQCPDYGIIFQEEKRRDHISRSGPYYKCLRCKQKFLVNAPPQQKEERTQTASKKPHRFPEPLIAGVRQMSRGVVAVLDKRRGKRTRREFTEYIIMTHPLLVDDFASIPENLGQTARARKIYAEHGFNLSASELAKLAQCEQTIAQRVIDENTQET